MHIFVDESGVFNPATNPKASCLAAVIVPSSKKVKILREFARMSEHWPHDEGEIKGYLLQETHISQVVKLLYVNDALVEITAFDSALQSKTELEQVKESVARRISTAPRWATPQLRPPRRIGAAYGNTSLQLFIQTYLMQSLIYNVIQSSLLYYARRSPKELKGFHWLVDQKNHKLNKFDRAWSEIAFPSIANITRERPFELLDGGDYSYLERPDSTTHQSHSVDKVTITLGITDTLKTALKFADSKLHLGLQLADVIANAVCCAFNETEKRGGWQGISSLILERPLQAVPFILLTDDKSRAKKPINIKHPFASVVKELSRDSRKIHLDPEGEKRLARQVRKRDKNLKNVKYSRPTEGAK